MVCPRRKCPYYRFRVFSWEQSTDYRQLAPLSACGWHKWVTYRYINLFNVHVSHKIEMNIFLCLFRIFKIQLRYKIYKITIQQTFDDLTMDNFMQRRKQWNLYYKNEIQKMFIFSKWTIFHALVRMQTYLFCDRPKLPGNHWHYVEAARVAIFLTIWNWQYPSSLPNGPYICMIV